MDPLTVQALVLLKYLLIVFFPTVAILCIISAQPERNKGKWNFLLIAAAAVFVALLILTNRYFPSEAPGEFRNLLGNKTTTHDQENIT